MPITTVSQLRTEIVLELQDLYTDRVIAREVFGSKGPEYTSRLRMWESIPQERNVSLFEYSRALA